MYYDFRCIYVNLPDTVHACTVPDPYDDSYIIVVNSKLAHNAQERAIKHELEHIRKDDCYNDKEVAETLEMYNDI